MITAETKGSRNFQQGVLMKTNAFHDRDVQEISRQRSACTNFCRKDEKGISEGLVMSIAGGLATPTSKILLMR